MQLGVFFCLNQSSAIMIKATHLDEGLEMSNLRSIVFRSKRLLFIAIVLSLNACGNGEAEDTAARTPTVDPRFASADTLVDYFNSIPSLGNDAGPAFVELLYAETPFQEQFLSNLRIGIDLHWAEVAMYERFGTTLRDDGEGDLLQRSIRARASAPSVEGLRATADMIDGENRSRSPLYLVRIGDRWWISCYTFEYTMSDRDKAEQAELAPIHEAMAAAGRAVAPRLRSGEFATANEARAAYKLALLQYAIEHPNMRHGN